jgi:hypothetical protein
MAAIYSNGGNRWNILGFSFTKRDALSSVYKIYMVWYYKDGPRFVLYNLADYFGDATEWRKTVKFFISPWYG